MRLEAWAATVSAGIAVGTILPAIAPAFVLATGILSVGALYWGELVPVQWRPMAVLAPLFAATGIGIASLHAGAPDPLAELAALQPGEVVIVGEIASPPVASSWGYRADVRVEHLWHGGREILRGGGVEVFAGDLSVGVGDRVRVDGEISRPQVGEDGFDYARYLSTKRISAVVEATSVWPVDENRGWIGRVHRRTDAALGYGLHPREAAVVRGMVLGDRSLIPEELDEAFQRSGVTHVLAISGQHVAVLAAVLYFALRAFSVPAAARILTTLALVWAYIVLAGAPPSAIRAGVVASLVLCASLIGRQVSPLHFMTTMLACVLAYNPLLVFNAGFQLSVAAVFGILLLRKPLESLVEGTLLRSFENPPRSIANLLAVSLAAQAATTPIVAASFDQVSLIGPLTNLIAVPLSGPILTLGLVASALGNVAAVLAYPLNVSNGFLVALLIWTAQAAASVPFAAATTPGVTPLLVALFYAGCVPAALCGVLLPEKQGQLWAAVLVLWSILWLVLVGVGGL